MANRAAVDDTFSPPGGKDAQEDIRTPMYDCSYESTSVRTYSTFAAAELRNKSDSSEALDEVLQRYGGPLKLLLTTWMALIPIVGPLMLVTISSAINWDFFMPCKQLDDLPRRAACHITALGTSAFPTITRMVAYCLVTWRFCRQRLFYVFVQHRIFIHFQTRLSWIRVVTSIQLLSLALACAHFVLKLLWDKELHKWICASGCLEDDSDGKGVYNLLWRLCIAGIPHDDEVEWKKARKVQKWLLIVCWQWVVPALVATIYTYAADDAESALVPVSKVFETGPRFVTNYIGASISVQEDVAREVLQRDEDGFIQSINLNTAKAAFGALQSMPSNLNEMCLETVGTLGEEQKARESQIQEDQLEEEEIARLVEDFKMEALQFEGCSYIANNRQGDVEIAAASNKVASLAPLDVYSLATRVWWPLEVVLKEADFRTVWHLHLSAICILLVLEFIWRGFSLAVCTGWMTGGWSQKSSVLYIALNLFLMGLSALVAWSVVSHIIHASRRH